MKRVIEKIIFSATIISLLFVFANAQELRLEILNGHSGGGVLAVAVSDDGKFALTGSTDQTALLWDLETGKQLRRFYRKQQTDIDANGKEIVRTIGHEDAVSVVQFSKDGKYVLTASYDKTAQLWETATGRQIRYFSEYKNGVRIGHSAKILTAAISPDGKLVATAGEDKTARIWDLASGKQKHLIQHAGRVNSIAFSPDSKLLLTGGEDKIARLFSTETGKEEKQFVGHTEEIMLVYFISDGDEILTIDDPWLGEGIGLLWNTKKGELVEKIENFNLKQFGSLYPNYVVNYYGETTSVNKVSISYNLSSILVSGGNQDDLRSNYSRFSSKIVEGSYNPFGSTLWNFKSGEPSPKWENVKQLDFKKIVNEAGCITTRSNDLSGVLSPNGDFIVYSFKGVSGIKFLEEEKENQDRFICNGLLKIVDISQNGEFFLSGSLDERGTHQGLLTIWHINTGKKRVFNINESELYSTAFSPNGKTLATVESQKNIVRLWNSETGEVKQIIKDFSTPVWSVAFSPDGKTIATASGGDYDSTKTGIGEAAQANSIQFWNVETGEKVGGFAQISDDGIVRRFVGFKSVTYSPDGKFIAAGSFDGKVYLYNSETKELKKFEGHTDTVNSVKFAKDANGKLLVVSGSSDSTTRIWDAATGEEICALVTFRDGNWAVVQTRTGRYDAPNGGEIEGIQWVFGNETIELAQLKDIYYTPNLLPRLLGYNPEPLADVRPLSEIKLFPEIVERSFDKKTLQLTVKLKNRGGGIGAVRVMVNDKLATEDARSADLIEKLKVNTNLAEVVVNYDLSKSAGINPNGKNRIEVFTYDFDQKTKQSYVSSDPKRSSRGVETFYIGNKDELKKPTLYAVVGGVSDYNGSQLDLNFAAKDAEDFANALGIAARRLFCPQENLKCDDKVKIKLLTTNDTNNLPTKPNFRKAFEEIAKVANPEDVLVVYLAGHGTSLTVGDADTYFYLTQESDNGSKDAVAKNPERSISNTELLGWLTQENWRADKKGIDAKNQVLILDTCQAGTFETALKRDLSADQIRALEKLKSRTGLQILMGSAANQSAYEASQYGQGLLTYALLEGMKSGALNTSNELETGKWFDYAVNRVPKMDISNGTSGLQSPRVFGSTSIPVGILNEGDRNAIKILESPLPVFVKPFVFKKGDTFDTAGLIGIIAKKLDEQAYAQARGDNNVKQVGSLVYVDEDNFAGAYRITGTYTEENGVITIEPELRLDSKIIKTLEKVSGKDKEEVSEKLMDAVLKGLKEIRK